MRWPLVSVAIRAEEDLVLVRQRAKAIAGQLGFAVQDQTRVATALSEIARNAFGYGGGGMVEFGVDERGGEQSFSIRVSDSGPGIADVRSILEGRYVSTSGLGLGILGARRLLDHFDIQSQPGLGTVVTLGKALNTGQRFDGAATAILARGGSPVDRLDAQAAAREQNRELLRSLAALAEREEETRRLNRELEETNRGVVALYADLDSKAEALRVASETLETTVALRTAQLAESNAKLKAEAEARERMGDDLRQAQKMEAVGQLTGGIAHDFNNLLTGIVGSLDMVRRRLKQNRLDKIEGYIDVAMSSAERASALTHRLLAFSRRQPLDPQHIDANALIAGMDHLLRRSINEAITLRIDPAAEPCTTLCDPHQLENAILNLAINARDAMPEGGSLTIGTSVVEALDETDEATSRAYVCASVADTGTGMPPDVVARAFDPFFTTKPLGKGTGLGLSMIYGFARQSGGRCTIDSELGRGTTIRLLLPFSAGEKARSPLAAAAPAAGGRGEAILVVEDEEMVRHLVVEALREAGYHVREAVDGPSGISEIARMPVVDLLVSDVGLPGLNGRQMADAMRTTSPALKVLFMTGYAEGATAADGFLDEGMAILTKPFDVEALLTKVRSVLDGQV